MSPAPGAEAPSLGAGPGGGAPAPTCGGDRDRDPRWPRLPAASTCRLTATGVRPPVSSGFKDVGTCHPARMTTDDGRNSVHKPKITAVASRPTAPDVHRRGHESPRGGWPLRGCACGARPTPPVLTETPREPPWTRRPTHTARPQLFSAHTPTSLAPASLPLLSVALKFLSQTPSRPRLCRLLWAQIPCWSPWVWPHPPGHSEALRVPPTAPDPAPPTLRLSPL